MCGSKVHFKGLFDLEGELAGSLNKACSDSPRHVFGFIDAYNLRRARVTATLRRRSPPSTFRGQPSIGLLGVRRTVKIQEFVA